MKTTLPTDSAARKNYPMYSGLICYFPAALAGVAIHSKNGNDKHNFGQELHHSRGKSGDHPDCIARHLTDLGDILAAIKLHDSVMPEGYGATTRAEYVRALLTEADAQAWRALALSQELHEKYGGAPLAPAARLPEPSPQLPLYPTNMVDEQLHEEPYPRLQGYPNPRCARCLTDPCTC